MLAKSLSFLAGADAAGIVLGARVPIILTSRADSVIDAGSPPAALPRWSRKRVAKRSQAKARAPEIAHAAAMADAIVVLNAGSSSFKFSLFADSARGLDARRARAGRGVCTHRRASLRRTGLARSSPTKSWGEGASARSRRRARSPRRRSCVSGSPTHRLVGVGHRVVHGGLEYAEPVRVDAAVLAALEKVRPAGAAAPAAQPGADPGAARAPAATSADCVLRYRVPPWPAAGRAGVRAAEVDHRSRRHPLRLPRPVVRVHRAGVLPEHDRRAAAGKVDRAASRQRRRACARSRQAAASRARWDSPRPTDSPMGTRCGSLDPGVVLYLMDELEMDARAIEKLIYQQSGLLGVSGISSDMRTLEASAEPAREGGDRPLRLPDRPRARLARRRARRARRDRVHGGHRREQPVAARARLPRRRVARRRAGSPPPTPRGGARASAPRASRVSRVGHPDQRGADDRASYAQRCSMRRAERDRAMTADDTPRHGAQRTARRLVDRRRERALDRLWLRQGVPRARRGSRDHLSQRQGASRYVEPLARALDAPLLLPLDVARARRARGRCSTQVDRELGRARHPRPLDRASRRRKTCRAGCSTARPRASRRRWTCRATRSCGWRSLAAPLMKRRRDDVRDELPRRATRSCRPTASWGR